MKSSSSSPSVWALPEPDEISMGPHDDDRAFFRSVPVVPPTIAHFLHSSIPTIDNRIRTTRHAQDKGEGYDNMENEKLRAKRLILDSWKAKMVGDQCQSLNLFKEAIDLDEGLLKRIQVDNVTHVEIHGITYNQSGDAIMASASESAKEVDDDGVEEFNPDLDIVRNADIDLPRSVPYHVLCDSKIWVADVLNSQNVALKYFRHSKSVHELMFFISHCWTDDDYDDKEYGIRKNFEFQNVVQNHILKFHPVFNVAEWLSSATFWFDKACIPQFDATKRYACIARLEEFIRCSNGLIVLMNEKYLQRLWCVFEWACFLTFHHPRDIFISYWMFPTMPFPSIINQLQFMDLKSLGCTFEKDRKALLDKVSEHYKDEDAFLRFVRITVIALAVRDHLNGVAKLDWSKYDKYVVILLDLASRLGLYDLRTVLEGFHAPDVYVECGGSSVQADAIYVDKLRSYFEAQVYPCLIRERDAAARKKDPCAQNLGKLIHVVHID